MKKFSKGMVITSTVAAALAALTFAGCGSTANEMFPAKTTASAAQAVKNEEAAKPVTAVKAEAAEAATTEKAAEKTAAKKNNKKSNKKKAADTAQKNTQPAVIVPTAQVQPAQTQKAAEVPAVTIPDDVYPVWVEGDVYAGTYAEEIAGRGAMEITRNSDGTYSVEVNWSSSAFEKNIWNFSGEFNGRGVMYYTNCRKTTVAFDENGNYAYDSNGLMTPYTTYTMGSGYIEFKDEGVLEWHDDMGDIIPGTKFIACKAYNTKADEVGTAGSCYYENEHTKADEVGTAGSCYYENEHTKADEVGTAGSCYYENEHTKADEVGTAGSNYYNFNYDWEADGLIVTATATFS